MSERLLPETVTALCRAERRWLDQARDRLRRVPPAGARSTPSRPAIDGSGRRDEEAGR